MSRAQSSLCFVFVLISTACGTSPQATAPGPSPSAATTSARMDSVTMGELVRRTPYTVALDYSTFYLYDRRNVAAEHDDVPALAERAIAGDGIARGLGTVVIMSPHQNNFAMSLTVEQWDGVPPDDLADWQEGYLTSLDVDQHGLMYQSPTPDGYLLDLPAGTWQARITGRGFVNRGWPGTTTPGDTWRIQAWPTAERAELRRIAHWTPDEPAPPSTTP